MPLEIIAAKSTILHQFHYFLIFPMFYPYFCPLDIYLNWSDIVHQAQELLSSFQVFDAEGTGPLVVDLGTGRGP